MRARVFHETRFRSPRREIENVISSQCVLSLVDSVLDSDGVAYFLYASGSSGKEVDSVSVMSEERVD